DKNIELRFPAPLDPNALLEDDAEPRDVADVLEDVAEPGEEWVPMVRLLYMLS
ncbi:hypothetical protein Tco_1572798, partial [Tanacetum coccineum]